MDEKNTFPTLYLIVGKNEKEVHFLKKDFKFKNFSDSQIFINKVSEISENENHHPDISIGWCSVKIEFTSHDLGGVTENCIKMATLATNLFEE